MMLARRLNGVGLIALLAGLLGLVPAAMAQIAQTPPEAPNAAAAPDGTALQAGPAQQLTAKRPAGAGVRLGEAPLPGQSSPASSRPSPATAAQAGLSPQDKNFLIRAAEGGMLQMELGKVAATRGTDPQLRQYAMLAAQRFGKAQGRLYAMAVEFGVPLPHRPSQDVVKRRQGLETDSGPAVNGQYAGQILPANTVAVNLFNSEAHNGRNPVLVQFARQMLPQLQERRQKLLRLSRDMGGGVARASPNPPIDLPKQQVPRHAAGTGTAIRHG